MMCNKKQIPKPSEEYGVKGTVTSSQTKVFPLNFLRGNVKKRAN